MILREAVKNTQKLCCEIPEVQIRIQTEGSLAKSKFSLSDLFLVFLRPSQVQSKLKRKTLEKLKEAHHQTYSDQASAKQTGLGAFESVANPQTSSDVSTQLLILLTTLQKELLLPCNCGEAGIDGTSTVPETH